MTQDDAKMMIEYMGRIYVFKKPGTYTEKMFQDRCWFIVKNKTMPSIESWADMWVSKKYYGVGYSQEIMQHLIDLEAKLWT